MNQISFNSSKQTDYTEIHAPYYNAIEPTAVFFEKEKISAFVNSLGHIEFFDEQNNSLGFTDVPAAESPDMYGHSGQYGKVRCMSDGKTVRFKLPIYDWEDSYPHCDGESDRWTRRTIRHFYVIFDCETQRITVTD